MIIRLRTLRIVIPTYGSVNFLVKSGIQHPIRMAPPWIYHLNMGEAFIPFNFGYRPKIRIVNFDKDGKVARWSYSK